MGLGLDTTIDQFEKLLSPQAVAKLRHKLGHRRHFYPFGTAMNGQTSRLEMTRQILFGCQIEQIVETGTFRATTTEWFAQFGLPVTTVESNQLNYEFARLRLARLENARVELGNSSETLARLAERMDTSRRTFFYLDAHWEDYLPLHDEMEVIASNFAHAVVLVDDFEVPGDPGYGYDNYGPGKALNTEYLHACLRPGMKVFYPTTPASQETGRRRGWVVITSDAGMAAWLDKAPLLYAASI